MGVAALILGICSVVFSIFPILGGYIGAAIMGVLGIILAAVGKKKGAKCATGGLVLSIIGTALSVVFWLACAACVAAVA